MKDLLQISELSQLLERFNQSDLEIGMIELGIRKHSFPVPPNYRVIGRFECDPLVIDPATEEVIMLDHEYSGRVMGKVAKDVFSFVKALNCLDEHYAKCEENEELFEDESLMLKTANQTAALAGGDMYLNFFRSFFGI